jgi:hypothetical protein
MKIAVAVKRVIDANVKAMVKSDGSGVDLANVKMSMDRSTRPRNWARQGKPSRQRWIIFAFL